MGKNKLFPVIHAVDEKQALRNTGIAFDCGADGVFLINHDISPTQLERIYREVRREYQDEFIGLNFLGCTPIEAVNRFPRDASGIWMDDVGYTEGDVHKVEDLVYDLRTVAGHEAILFGGVDFKYREPVADLSRAIILLAPLVDVLTTSGEATGIPPSLEKMRTIQRALRLSKKPDALTALASGVTIGNINSFRDVVDYFLVATGISDSHTELNRDKVRRMVGNERH